MKASLLLSAGAASATIPTVHMPINFKYGSNEKVSTDLKLPYSNETITVCYDLGSSDFWLFRPDAIQNWGRNCLSCQGLCNRTVPAVGVYDAAKSASASAVVPHSDVLYAYGGGLSKAYHANALVNDTFTFVNDAGYATEVPDVQVALAYYLQQRILDPNGTCEPVPTYDYSIMGISPYMSPDPNIKPFEPGPSFRKNLLDEGRISNNVQSMWFEKAPADLEGTYTGSGLQGGLDTSKFSGPLVKVASFLDPFGTLGYLTVRPNVTFVADGAAVPVPIDRTGTGSNLQCTVDSGSTSDGIAPLDVDAFLNVTGLRYNPARPNGGEMLSWPASCDTIPTDGDQAFLTYTFPSADNQTTVAIDMPLRAYARGQEPEDAALGWCTMRLYLGTCMLGAPFATRSFFAADDDRVEIALAQGGVAERGSGVNYDYVVDRIP